MTDREYSVVEAIGRINRFADAHLTAFPTGTYTVTARNAAGHESQTSDAITFTVA